MIEGMDRGPTTVQFCSISLNWINFYYFIYFSKSFGEMPIANPFISKAKAGCKLVTPPDMVIAKGKISVAILSPDLP